MKRIFKHLLFFISVWGLILTARLIYLAGFKTWEIWPNGLSVHSTNKYLMKCNGTSITRGSSLGPISPSPYSNISLHEIRIDHWHKRARITIAENSKIEGLDKGIGVDLGIGEYFSPKGVGKITLMKVDIDWIGFAFSGSSANSTATFCLEPTPEFKREARRIDNGLGD